uniref:Ribosomal protein L5 n=1 Tax=Medakamo hakoo TaxID=3113649 RepID=A0A8E4BWY0_9CHLO|nr:ribosomal protein L5 [Medakamo hakoo]
MQTFDPRFLTYYQEIVCPDLLLKLPVQSIHQLPKIEKIVLHSSSGNVAQDKKRILPILLGFEYLTGQKPATIWSKKSIASFRLRKDSLLGCRVTLRKNALYSFFEKYSAYYLPRVYDWQTLKQVEKQKSFELSSGHRDPFLFFELEPLSDNLQGFQGFQLSWKINAIEFSKTSKVSENSVNHLVFSAFQYI